MRPYLKQNKNIPLKYRPGEVPASRKQECSASLSRPRGSFHPLQWSRSCLSSFSCSPWPELSELDGLSLAVRAPCLGHSVISPKKQSLSVFRAENSNSRAKPRMTPQESYKHPSTVWVSSDSAGLSDEIVCLSEVRVVSFSTQTAVTVHGVALKLSSFPS